ncbi:MAG: hypothetical protein MI924_09895 [Chloroflexales bacterium]|nr:hypothetical protein [Chloroflexales bacterium]
MAVKETISPTSEQHPLTTPDMDNLLGILRDALAINPPRYLSSIFGLPQTWMAPKHRFSEFQVIDFWRLERSIRYVLNVTIPSIPQTPPASGWPLLNSFFWKPTVILQRPDHYGSYTSFPYESWFFINGVMTNDAVAQVNAAYLSYLFHRPITLIQNSTCGIFADLIECAIGKEWHRTTEAAAKAFPAIYDALKSEKRRVVVIAHSQGTIIAAVVLRMLGAITEVSKQAVLGGGFQEIYAEPEFVFPDHEEIRLSDFETLSEEELTKLELYCFANCATKMPYFRAAADGVRPMPWIESFGNEYDIVARLGMQAPNSDKWGIHIDGPRYVVSNTWGHLLNEHYLRFVHEHQKVRYIKRGQGGVAPYQLINPDSFSPDLTPRLFAYINGGSPT